MQSYRFDGLVQGRLLHLQLALLKLVKVIPTLRRTQTGHFQEVETTEWSFIQVRTEGEALGAALLIKLPLIKQDRKRFISSYKTSTWYHSWLQLYFRKSKEKLNRFNFYVYIFINQTALGARDKLHFHSKIKAIFLKSPIKIFSCCCLGTVCSPLRRMVVIFSSLITRNNILPPPPSKHNVDQWTGHITPYVK